MTTVEHRGTSEEAVPRDDGGPQWGSGGGGEGGKTPGALTRKISGSSGHGGKGSDRVDRVYRPPGFWLVWKDTRGSFMKSQNKKCCMRTRFEGSKDKCAAPVRHPR